MYEAQSKKTQTKTKQTKKKTWNWKSHWNELICVCIIHGVDICVTHLCSALFDLKSSAWIKKTQPNK